MNKPKFGATGEFPRGRLNEHDEGEIALGVRADLEKKVVVIDFGTQVTWLGLPLENAVQFAELILKNARKLGPFALRLGGDAGAKP